MDALTLFGLFAASAMLVCYAFEDRCHWFALLFAASCALGSAYGFMQGAWPFGIVEAVWSAVAFRRWRRIRGGLSEIFRPDQRPDQIEQQQRGHSAAKNEIEHQVRSHHEA